jgi:hypothetical protein
MLNWMNNKPTKQLDAPTLMSEIESRRRMLAPVFASNGSAAVDYEFMERVWREMVELKQALDNLQSCRLCGTRRVEGVAAYRLVGGQFVCGSCGLSAIEQGIEQARKEKKICSTCDLHHTQCICDKNKGIKKLQA